MHLNPFIQNKLWPKLQVISECCYMYSAAQEFQPIALRLNCSIKYLHKRMPSQYIFHIILLCEAPHCSAYIKIINYGILSTFHWTRFPFAYCHICQPHAIYATGLSIIYLHTLRYRYMWLNTGAGHLIKANPWPWNVLVHSASITAAFNNVNFGWLGCVDLVKTVALCMPIYSSAATGGSCVRRTV